MTNDIHASLVKIRVCLAREFRFLIDQLTVLSDSFLNVHVCVHLLLAKLAARWPLTQIQNLVKLYSLYSYIIIIVTCSANLLLLLYGTALQRSAA